MLRLAETVTLSWDMDGTPAELLYKGLIFNIGLGFAFRRV